MGINHKMPIKRAGERRVDQINLSPQGGVHQNKYDIEYKCLLMEIAKL